jgi:hypothetical protein
VDGNDSEYIQLQDFVSDIEPLVSLPNRWMKLAQDRAQRRTLELVVF